MTLEEAKKNLIIDVRNIITVCAEQAHLFDLVGTEAVYAVSIRDQLKEVKDTLFAKLFQEAFENQDGVKMTKDRAGSIVQQNILYQEAVTSYLDAKKIAEEWEIKKEAFNQRNYMIHDLVQLTVAGLCTQNNNVENLIMKQEAERNKKQYYTTC